MPAVHYRRSVLRALSFKRVKSDRAVLERSALQDNLPGNLHPPGVRVRTAGERKRDKADEDLRPGRACGDHRKPRQSRSALRRESSERRETVTDMLGGANRPVKKHGAAAPGGR